MVAAVFLVSFMWDETAQLIRICTSEHGLWGLTHYTHEIWNCMDVDSLLKTVTAAVIRGQVYVQVRNLGLATDLHEWALLPRWARNPACIFMYLRLLGPFCLLWRSY